MKITSGIPPRRRPLRRALVAVLGTMGLAVGAAPAAPPPPGAAAPPPPPRGDPGVRGAVGGAAGSRGGPGPRDGA
ncbi:hypothetical protein ACIOFZ_16025, partial [Streptomyces nodosus]